MIAFSPARAARQTLQKDHQSLLRDDGTRAGSFPAGDGGQSGSRSALWFLGVYGLW